MTTAKEIAVHYMKAARLLFLAEGEVMPVISFFGGSTNLVVQVRPNPKFHPSDQSCAIAFAFGTVLQATHLVTVNEAWVKKFGAPEEAERMDRGYLEELHKQGDMAVHTALLVIAADLKNHEDSCVFTIDVDAGESEEWTQTDLALGEGSMLDRLLYAWDHGKENFMEDMEWPVVASILAKSEVISQVAAFGTATDIDDLADVFKRMKAEDN